MAYQIVPSKKTALVYSDPKESGEYEYVETPLFNIVDQNGGAFVSDVTRKEADSILRLLQNDAPVINNSGISLWV